MYMMYDSKEVGYICPSFHKVKWKVIRVIPTSHSGDTEWGYIIEKQVSNHPSLYRVLKYEKTKEKSVLYTDVMRHTRGNNLQLALDLVS
jgi:hypothetical protein